MSNEIIKEEAHVAGAAFFSMERIQPALPSAECKDDDAPVPFISGVIKSKWHCCKTDGSSSWCLNLYIKSEGTYRKLGHFLCSNS